MKYQVITRSKNGNHIKKTLVVYHGIWGKSRNTVGKWGKATFRLMNRAGTPFKKTLFFVGRGSKSRLTVPSITAVTRFKGQICTGMQQWALRSPERETTTAIHVAFIAML